MRARRDNRVLGHSSAVVAELGDAGVVAGRLPFVRDNDLQAIAARYAALEGGLRDG